MAELRIMITVPLTGNLAELGEAFVEIGEPLSALAEAANGKEWTVKVLSNAEEAETPKPRKQRADAGKARKAPPVIREAAE